MKTFADLITEKTSILIGASTANAFVLADEDVADKHCQITHLADKKYLIADLGSASGTFVNNERITAREISEQDFIQVGSYIFQLKTVVPAEKSSAPAQKIEIEPEIAVAPIPLFKPVGQKEVVTQKVEEVLNPAKSLRIYCLYAPEDEGAAVFLDKHLTALRYNAQQPIEIQGAFKRQAGDDKTLDDNNLSQADIILVFLSVNIMDDATYRRSMIALDFYNKGKAKLIPILTRRCLWNQMPFGKLPLLPKNLEPLYSKRGWDSEDEAFTNVVEDIGKTVNEYYTQKEHQQFQPEKIKAVIPKFQLKIDYKADYKWSLFFKRMVAYMIDILLFGIPSLIVLAIFGMDINTYENGVMQMETTIVLLLFLILFGAFFESRNWRATPGKMIFGLIITDVHGEKLTYAESLKRNAIKFLIVLVMQDITLSILLIVGQIAYYMAKGKFIHDEISKTLISPSDKKAERIATSLGA